MTKLESAALGRIDSDALLRIICRLNRFIDNHLFADYWQVGIELLSNPLAAQSIRLYLLEEVQGLASEGIEYGTLSPPIAKQIQAWEQELDEVSFPSAAGLPDDSLPPTSETSFNDGYVVCFPIILNRITRGAISIVWPHAVLLSSKKLAEVHQIVQLYVSNGLRANQVIVTNRSLERSNLLYLIAQELTSTLNLTTVLNQTTQMAASVLGAQASTLFEVDHTNQELIFMIPKGAAASVLQAERMPIDQGVVGWVATHGKSIIVNNTDESELFDSDLIDSQTGFKTQNILCVPLRLQERTIGVLEVLNKEAPNGFTVEDEQWLVTMGNQVAIAFDNARLFNRERKRVSELATLNSLSQTINSELDVSAILDKITESVLDILSASRSELLLVSQDRRFLELVSSAGLGSKLEVPPLRVPIGHGLIGWCASQNKPVKVRRAAQDERYLSRDSLPQLDSMSAAAVPMAHRGRVIGAIMVFVDGNTPLDDDQIDLLSTFANQAAISLQNADLYQSMQAEQERIIKAQEEVRHQLARDLHDNTAQMLSLIIMNLDLAKQMLSTQNANEVEEELDSLEELARQANREIRTLLFELRPIILESRGLIPALDSYQHQLNQSMDCSVHVDAHPLPFQIKLQGASAIFSIVQEAVNNIRKHARARNIWIRVFVDQANLHFHVEDDGIGFDIREVTNNYDGLGSFGLLNMNERAALLGGKLTFHSPRPNDTGGTLVEGTIPLSILRSKP
ncbi:MAG: GAF domain-containing sensor histidine kinase [Chloroflexota bacterium]